VAALISKKSRCFESRLNMLRETFFFDRFRFLVAFPSQRRRCLIIEQKRRKTQSADPTTSQTRLPFAEFKRQPEQEWGWRRQQA
jgi:hypothetical protein